MLQLRHKDGRAYSLGRDLANLFPRLCQQACNLLGIGGWHPKVKDWAEQSGLTQNDLVRAEIALAKFVAISTTDQARSKEDAWVNSGLANLHPAAQIMLLFFVGSVTLDTYLRSVREGTKAGQAAHGAARLIETVERLAHAQSADSSRTARRRTEETVDAMDKLQSPNEFDS